MYIDIRKVNPYYIYSFIVTMVVFLYELRWSILYPKLSLNVVIFLILTVVASFFLGSFYNNNIQRNGLSSETKNEVQITFSSINKLITYFVIAGVILDGVYSKGFPLFGGIRYGEDYGVPILHVITTILGSYEIVVDTMIFLKSKNHKRRALLNIIVLLAVLSLNLSRSLILITLMNALWIVVYNRTSSVRLNWSMILKIGIVGIISMYIFGIAGNYRSNVQLANNRDMFDSSVIYQIGEPSKEFRASKIPAPFFWDYIYITSALGNFQKITDSRLIPKGDLEEYIITQYFPSLISQRIYPLHKEEINTVTTQYRVTSVLNVGTVYFESFYLMGWTGVILLDIFLMVFPIVYMMLIFGINKRYAVYGIAILNTMYVMMLFDNMMSFTLISIQLILPLIHGFLAKNIKVRIKY